MAEGKRDKHVVVAWLGQDKRESERMLFYVGGQGIHGGLVWSQRKVGLSKYIFDGSMDG